VRVVVDLSSLSFSLSPAMHVVTSVHLFPYMSEATTLPMWRWIAHTLLPITALYLLMVRFQIMREGRERERERERRDVSVSVLRPRDVFAVPAGLQSW